MVRIKFFTNFAPMLVSGIALFVFAACGTTSTIKQPLTPVSSVSTSAGNQMYGMGSCDVQDNRATGGTCVALQDRLQYGLFSHGLYEKNEGEADREIRLTITYFRDLGPGMRSFFGVLAGKDGMDVKVEVVNRKDGKIVGSASVSSYNITAADFSEKGMVEAVSAKIVAFLMSGASE